jgi:lipoprotein NlpD
VTRLARLTSLSAALALALGACTQSVMVAPANQDLAPPAPREQTTTSAPTYVVQQGDTLYKISMQYGVDYRELASWNGIGAPYTIYPKQTLRVGPGKSTAAAPAETVAIAAPAAPAATSSSPAPGSERAGSAVVASGAPTTATQPPVGEGYNAELGVTLPAGAQPIGAPSTAANSAAAPVFEPVAAATTAAGSAPTTVESLPEAAPARPDTTAPLRTAPAAPAPAAPEPAVGSADIAATKPSSAGWTWPTPGKVVVTYASGDPTRQGIDIVGELGQPVRAARDGEVVYSGAGLIGYGELVIIKHSPELLSAYGHNRVRLVKEGDKVKSGQKIAEMGKNAANRVLLHFEVRKNGKPVDPLPLLPAR